MKNCRSKDKHPDVTAGDIVFRFERSTNLPTFKQQIWENEQFFCFCKLFFSTVLAILVFLAVVGTALEAYRIFLCENEPGT